IDSREENRTAGIADAQEQIPAIQRVIDGRLYTVKIHFRDGATRTAKETMKSILMHEIDARADSEGNFN
ncbi:MAG: hypothetical protein SPL94_07585, partial [Oribacterium sp.]|nr:hypothetical protein [Oribacterium sp.]